ncbi:MAG: RNA-metabolising metallo-beta-lactamase, metallo-beta-lactamase family protein, partial [Candidatus Taylorbacteria bacterium]|nr:RNA-metabolising metallo-beta-lactamase, metallo-beta-lactamase family protein [Candidatus Taylorbacteria bacterium]
NFILEIGRKPSSHGGVGEQPWRVLIDCGLIQGAPEDMIHNRDPFLYDPASIDMLFVTHAHLDHVGRIAKLVKDGFRGAIYSTLETMELGKLIMEDGASLISREARSQGILPLYEQKDIDMAMGLWKTLPYHAETPMEGGLGDGKSASFGFSVYLKDAGHILGSSMYRFTCNEEEKGKKGEVKIISKNVIFTGDLGNSPTPILRDTESIEDAQYIVMESVYGDRNHEPKDHRRAKLEQIIKDTIARGGTLIIPAFSVERTQVLLFELNELVETKRIPVIPIFVDSPLAIKVTDIYRASKTLFNDAAQAQIARGDDIFSFPKLSYTMTSQESQAIDHVRAPKIILAGSGMSMGGRVTHHESIYLPDPKNTVLLVGYQPPGTLGRRLLDAGESLLPNRSRQVSINGEKITVAARIESIMGYSAHKDSDRLVEFVATGKDTLKQVFVVMGEPKAATFLAQRLNNEVGVNAIHPDANVIYSI